MLPFTKVSFLTSVELFFVYPDEVHADKVHEFTLVTLQEIFTIRSLATN